MLDVPMYFVLREGKYLDASGMSFRDFLAGKLALLPGQQPLLSDWETHLSTVFPQVRLKQFLEMRGADAGDGIKRVPALAALWAGLLYDPEALEEAWSGVQDWTLAERRELESEVARKGFATRFREGTIRDLALWMLGVSRQGLKRRNFRNAENEDESRYLDPLQMAADSGNTFAEDLMRKFSEQWQQDIDLAFPAMCRKTFA